LYRENKNYNNVAGFKLQPVTCNLQRFRTVYEQQNYH